MPLALRHLLSSSGQNTAWYMQQVFAATTDWRRVLVL